jgi:hypothetical protein
VLPSIGNYSITMGILPCFTKKITDRSKTKGSGQVVCKKTSIMQLQKQISQCVTE